VDGSGDAEWNDSVFGVLRKVSIFLSWKSSFSVSFQGCVVEIGVLLCGPFGSSGRGRVWSVRCLLGLV